MGRILFAKYVCDKCSVEKDVMLLDQRLPIKPKCAPYGWVKVTGKKYYCITCWKSSGLTILAEELLKEAGPIDETDVPDYWGDEL